MSKNKARGAPKTWLHPAQHLVTGSIIYKAKYWGSTEVKDPQGADTVKGAIERLKFQVHVKKGQGHKPPKVEICVSYQALRVQDAKTQAFIHQHPLTKISYCGDDKSNKSVFAYIAKEKDTDSHFCYVFETDKFAEQITLTVGQAFDLAFKKFKGGSGESDVELRKKMMTMQQSMDDAEREKQLLRERIADLQMKKDMTDVEKLKLSEQVTQMQTTNQFDLIGQDLSAAASRPLPAQPPAPVAPMAPVAPVAPAAVSPVTQQQQQWATFDDPARGAYSTLNRATEVSTAHTTFSQPTPQQAQWATFDSPAAQPAAVQDSWFSQSATQVTAPAEAPAQSVPAPAAAAASQAAPAFGGGWASFDEPAAPQSTYMNAPAAGQFQPFGEAAPAPAVAPLGEQGDVDQALRDIEAQIAGLQDGIEMGFSLDPMSPTSPTSPAGPGGNTLISF